MRTSIRVERSEEEGRRKFRGRQAECTGLLTQHFFTLHRYDVILTANQDPNFAKKNFWISVHR